MCILQKCIVFGHTHTFSLNNKAWESFTRPHTWVFHHPRCSFFSFSSCGVNLVGYSLSSKHIQDKGRWIVNILMGTFTLQRFQRDQSCNLYVFEYSKKPRRVSRIKVHVEYIYLLSRNIYMYVIWCIHICCRIYITRMYCTEIAISKLIMKTQVWTVNS